MDMASTVTYSQLLELVCQIANYLQSIGVKKGDDVTIYMPMIPELPATMVRTFRTHFGLCITKDYTILSVSYRRVREHALIPCDCQVLFIVIVCIRYRPSHTQGMSSREPRAFHIVPHGDHDTDGPPLPPTAGMRPHRSGAQRCVCRILGRVSEHPDPR